MSFLLFATFYDENSSNNINFATTIYINIQQ